MATSYTAPLNLRTPSIASFTLPTNGATQSVASPYVLLPPPPLPQTLFGTTQQTSYST